MQAAPVTDAGEVRTQNTERVLPEPKPETQPVSVNGDALPTNGNGHGETELPSYEAQQNGNAHAKGPHGTRPRTVHTYSLTSGHKPKPWIYLKVHSRAPSEKSLPIFVGGETITGTVELDLPKTEHIVAISLTLKGETLQVGQEPIIFLSANKVLWNTEMGDANPTTDYSSPPSEKTPPQPHPQPPASTSSPGSSNPKGKTKEGSSKLKGTYSWPFTMEFPEHVEAPPEGIEKGLSKQSQQQNPQTFPLPPSLSERASPAYIDYKLVVTVHRGRFRIDHTLMTSLGFIPQIRAPPPTDLRQLAYQEGGQMAGPEADPEGWLELDPILVKGTLFESRSVEVEAKLSIGKPLAYALNTPIPLWLTLKSNDAQALDVLSAPASIRIILRRTLSIGIDAIRDDRDMRTDTNFDRETARAVLWPVVDPRRFTQGTPATDPNELPKRGRNWRERNNHETEGVVNPIAFAGATGLEERTIRVLEGEIYVKSSERPSFLFPRVALRHFIDLYPISATGFVPTEPANPPSTPGAGPRPLISKQVDLVTLSASTSGLLRSRAPPGYANDQAANYNDAVGMLTAANQRFIHIHGGMG